MENDECNQGISPAWANLEKKNYRVSYIVFQDEWEKELERLTNRFERELQTKKKRPDEQKVLTLRHQQEREDLEKHMTLRRDKKKESLTRKLLEHER